MFIWDTFAHTPGKVFNGDNGACINDEIVNGKVEDDRRISYMQQHLVQVHRAIHDGLHVKGYMACRSWTILNGRKDII